MDRLSRFTGHRIIVTGAASGIGRATVLRLLEEGGTVHGVDGALVARATVTYKVASAAPAR